jgi:hypothetical protein
MVHNDIFIVVVGDQDDCVIEGFSVGAKSKDLSEGRVRQQWRVLGLRKAAAAATC